MWHTSSGDREVKGAEAELIKAAITGMAEMIREESAGYMEQWEYGIQLFDELEWPQRLALLDQVATYLLSDTPDTLDLTAVNEAAVGAIFEHISVEIDWEIDTNAEREFLDIKEPLIQWRQMLLNVCAETFDDDGDDEFELPKLDSNEHHKWHELIEIFADGILWDRDFEMGSECFDSPPEMSNAIKQQMGIDDDYYSTPAPDAQSQSSIDELFHHLELLTGPETTGGARDT